MIGSHNPFSKRTNEERIAIGWWRNLQAWMRSTGHGSGSARAKVTKKPVSLCKCTGLCILYYGFPTGILLALTPAAAYSMTLNAPRTE
eukprot:1928946-Pleurochrysis_carterae.AAC.3